MKAWFYRHPNITFLACFAYTMLALWYLITDLNDRRWGWAAVDLVAAFWGMNQADIWWDRTGEVEQ